jgi:hypothetical protein
LYPPSFKGSKKHSSYKKKHAQKGGRRGKKKKKTTLIKHQSPMRKKQRIMTHFADGEAGPGVSQEDVSSITGCY